MADITEQLPDLPETASKYNEQFLEEMDRTLDILPTWTTKLNALALQIQSAKNEITVFRNTTISYKTATEIVKNEAVQARNEAVSARNDIMGYIIPTSATYSKDEIDKKALLDLEAESSAYGYTNPVPKKDRWMETDTPNVIVDKVGDPIRFSDGLVDRLGETIVDATLKLLVKWNSTAGGLETTIGLDFENMPQLETKLDKYSVVVYDDIGNRIIGTRKSDENVFMVGGSFTVGKKYNVKIYNELPQAELPLAPFAPNTTDELLDYSQHAVTTQIDHEKGDIVVCGNGRELVTNHDFSTSDLSSFSYDSNEGDLSISNGKLIAHRISGKNNFSFYTYFSEKVDLVCKIKISNSGNAHLDVWGNNTGKYLIKNLVDGEYTFRIPYYSTGLEFLILGDDTNEATIEIDSISITPIEQTYQAIENTTSGALVTDTTKFQEIDYVTRQDIIAYGRESKYKTYKGLHYFDEAVSVDEIAESRGWSKLGSGLFHDGTEEIVIAGLVPRLNAGAYHPVFNCFGVASYTKIGVNDFFWYHEGRKDYYNDTLYDTFIVDGLGYNGFAIGNINLTRRPDLKLADKIYYESNGGLIWLPTYSKDVSKVDLLKEKSAEFVNGENELGLDRGVVLTTMPTTPYKTRQEYIEDGTLILHNALLTQNTALTTDVIGDPTPYTAVDGNSNYQKVYKGYPNEWLDYLDSGKALPFNPLLVDSYGNSLLPCDRGSSYKSSKKGISKAIHIYNNAVSYIKTTDRDINIDTSFSNDLPSYDCNNNRIFALYQYQSKNNPLYKSDPLPVEIVESKVIASNSHSIHKGALITNQTTGKIAVGNGSNGLESKVLENCELVYDFDYTTDDKDFTLKTGECILVTLNSSDPNKNRIFKRLASDLHKADWNSFVGFNTDVNDIWEYIGELPTPTHQTINLDNSNSPAAKWFPVLAVAENNEYVIGVEAKELATNNGVYDGDNNKFDQLTNGIQTDLNGNTIRTFVGYQRTGFYKK